MFCLPVVPMCFLALLAGGSDKIGHVPLCTDEELPRDCASIEPLIMSGKETMDHDRMYIWYNLCCIRVSCSTVLALVSVS